MGQLFKRPSISDDKFERSDPDNLFKAIFFVLVRYQRDGKEPGAERWQADTRWHRPQLVNDIRDEWIRIIGEEQILPWHDDYILDCFVSLRKAEKSKKVATCEFYGIDVPAEWRCRENVNVAGVLS